MTDRTATNAHLLSLISQTKEKLQHEIEGPLTPIIRLARAVGQPVPDEAVRANSAIIAVIRANATMALRTLELAVEATERADQRAELPLYTSVDVLHRAVADALAAEKEAKEATAAYEAWVAAQGDEEEEEEALSVSARVGRLH